MTVEQSKADGRSFVERTHQMWKVYVFLLLLLVSAVTFILMVAMLNSAKELRWLPHRSNLAISTAVGGFAAMMWLWLSLRCPRCRLSLVSRIARTENASNWFSALLTVTQCPNCRSSGEDTA